MPSRWRLRCGVGDTNRQNPRRVLFHQRQRDSSYGDRLGERASSGLIAESRLPEASHGVLNDRHIGLVIDCAIVLKCPSAADVGRL